MCKLCKIREGALGNLHTSGSLCGCKSPASVAAGRTWPRSLGLSRGRAEAGQEAGCTAIKGREGDSGRKGRRSECRWPLRRPARRGSPFLARLHSSSYFTLYALRQSTCPRPTCQSGGAAEEGVRVGTHPAHLCLDRERNRNSNSEHSERLFAACPASLGRFLCSPE